MAGERLVQLLKGVAGMGPDLQDDVRAVLINVAEHPGARNLLDKQLPPDQQEAFLGPLPQLPFDYRYHVKGRA